MFEKIFKTKKKYDEFRFDVKTRYSYNIYASVYNYAGFNRKLPIPFLMEHSWYLSDELMNSDLKQNPKFMIVASKRRKKVWDEKSKVPTAIFGAPFVRYRHLAKITQAPDAKGTIAFPAHSGHLPCEGFEFDWKEYARTLKSLPDEYQPVDVCLHPNDIEDGADKILENEGLKVISATTYNPNQEFMQNFYEILRQYKYSTSNDISSSAMYAVELGLPFFLYGKYPTYSINEDGWDCPKGTFSENLAPEYIATSKIMPHEPTTKISKELKEYVDAEMGVYDCISPEELYQIILKNYTFSFIIKTIFARVAEVTYKLFALPYKKWTNKQ